MTASHANVSGFSRSSLLILVIVALTAVLLWLIFSTQPTAKKEGATKKTPMLVEVQAVFISSYSPKIKAMGMVKPARQVEIKPRVSGEIVQVSQKFEPGAYVKKGEWLVELDQQDYALELQRAEARLVQAKSAYAIEMGEQIGARKGLSLLDKNVSQANRSLVLREPQKQQAEAELMAAQSELKGAKLALDRTRILVPFDGQIITQPVNLGSKVETSDVITRIIGTERYWVEAMLPLTQLERLARSKEQRETEPVLIYSRALGKPDIIHQGRLKQVLAELDHNTRMARILIDVPDPLGLQSNDNDFSALIAGSYVEVELPIQPLENIIRLPLTSLRKQNTVWVMQNDELKIKSVDIIFKDDKYAYIQSGLLDGDHVITTDLSVVRQGASVRLKDSISTEQAQKDTQAESGLTQ